MKFRIGMGLHLSRVKLTCDLFSVLH